MSVHKRKDSVRSPWQVRWREGGRARSRSFRTRREAVAFDAQLQATPRLPAVPEAVSIVTVDGWLAEWMRTHGVGWAPSTRIGRALYGDKWIAPYLGRLLLVGLSRRDVSRWRAAMVRDGASADTVNHATRVLSAACGAAVDDGLIPANPCAGLRAMRHKVERPRSLTEAEVERLLSAAANHRDLRIVALMVHAGLRPGEVLGVRWSDWSGGMLHVQRSVRVDGSVSTPKSGHGRSVPVPPRLGWLLGTRLSSGGLICPRMDNEEPLIWRAWYRHQWKTLKAAAGVECAPYDLRHTFASHAIHAGASVVQVAAWMGHADPALTLRRYAHLFAEADHAASASFNSRAIRPNRPAG